MTHKATKRQRIIINTSTWDCSLCTYKNSCVTFRCEMCDSHKGTATRKPKIVVNVLTEQLPKSKHKTNEDYSSDTSFTDDSDIQDNDEEFPENERKTNHSHQIRRIDHNENSSSSSLTTHSFCSISPSLSLKINDHSNLSKTKKRSTCTSISSSRKLTVNNQKIFSKNQTLKSKDNNQKNKVNLLQQKKKNSKISSMSSSSSILSSTHNTTIITVDGISVQITELLPNETNSLINTNTLFDDRDIFRAPSSSSIIQTSSYIC
ncbi:unnamed protein product [Rotaria sp. Silwood2]|nr:unnamed protein product [Rotaria sp. Silwood2]CAF4177108.1 unnamed protein product [Rotaria sp. Silwood2]